MDLISDKEIDDALERTFQLSQVSQLAKSPEAQKETAEHEMAENWNIELGALNRFLRSTLISLDGTQHLDLGSEEAISLGAAMMTTFLVGYELGRGKNGN